MLEKMKYDLDARYVKTAKFSNLAAAYICSHLYSTPAFIRVIPTDRCNLDCKYCWQRNNVANDMSMESFAKYLDKALDLKVGMISFLGGEPMLWKPLYEAIRRCSKKHMLTDMTTNGTLLDVSSIKSLGLSGLDYLNISVDGMESSSISKKNSIAGNNLINLLKEAKERYRMHFRINSVIYNDNFDEIKKMIEFSKTNDVQLSIGYVVPPIGPTMNNRPDIYFYKKDRLLLEKIIGYILDKKKKGYPIIDPDAYFENIFRFLNHEKFWECNYPTRYGWINVTPSGKIRTCTKKMDELDQEFLNLDTKKLQEIRNILRDKVKVCNVSCYSNCAYDSYFYTHHKFQTLRKVLNRL